jgi:thiamine-phosphate pyrophosphorylase
MSSLLRTAIALGRRGRTRKAVSKLPSLWLVTDPARLADPAAAAGRLPRGSAVIFRAFGAPDALATALAIAAVARRRGLVFLVGADARLAAAAGADGVHLPERLLGKAQGLRRARPGWLITGAAHGRAALIRAQRAGLDAVLVSTVFESRSPSAGPALGPVRFAALARSAGLPVIALGGVTAETAPRLIGTGASGLAAVEGLSPPSAIGRALRT